MRETVTYDLKELLSELIAEQSGIEEIYLFGSRAYNTGSARSDCDLIVRAAPAKLTKSSDLRDFSMLRCPALDLFLCIEARATSCSNDSFVYAASFEELVSKLDAVKLWTRAHGFADFSFADSGTWTFRTAFGVEFIPTSLPDDYVSERSWHQKIKMVESAGLPVQPFIGDTLPKAVSMIQRVARAMIFTESQLGQRGRAAAGWTVNLQSEYDCQNLFFTVMKPWLPDLSSEEISINYDGQDKISDFSVFRGQLIIEMKFIDSDRKKIEVVKTLAGLSRFYSRNGNVGCLLLIIYVKKEVSVDASKWEADFSFMTTSPIVITMVVPIP